MYYLYDDKSLITRSSDLPPITGNWCQSSEAFDLDLNTVIVGAVNAGHNLTYRTVRAKPAEVLAANLKSQIAASNALGQQVAALTLSGAQKDTLISKLGQQMVQAQLDIAALKGGKAS